MKLALVKPTLARLALLFAALLPLAGCQRAFFWAVNASVPERDAETLVFDPVHGLAADVYRPDGTQAAPVVVFFYGGSWRNGRKEDYRFVGTALARQGLVVVIPDYRKAPANLFPSFMNDAAEAVAWTRTRAASIGGDPGRIFVMGHSAGAHIAALLATDGRYLHAVGMAPRDLRGVIGLAGPYDFLPFTDPKVQQVFGPEQEWPRSQPVNFVDGDEPPFLLLHGADDDLVWPRNSENLTAKLRAANESVTLEILPGVGHISLVEGFAYPRQSPVLDRSLRWIQARAAVAGRPCARGLCLPDEPARLALPDRPR